MSKLILGIETSCDDTGVALYDESRGLLGHLVYTQTLHAPYGGIVPELASRDHLKRIIPLLDTLLKEHDVSTDDITAVAYTAGPGLVGALLVGACIAESLAFGWQVPTIPVHHMEAHLLAAMLDNEKLKPPFVALLVSGGHSMIIDVAKIGEYRLLGETLDDAAGEAFDKTAKLLALTPANGATIAKKALGGDPKRYPFPRPMVNRPGMELSFSGLKTHTLTTWQASPQNDQARADIAAGFQEAVIDTLVIKCKRALEHTQYNQLVVAGGVGANRLLREQLDVLMGTLDGQVYFPHAEYCTDNAAMVAYTGWHYYKRGVFSEKREALVKARWPLSAVCGD